MRKAEIRGHVAKTLGQRHEAASSHPRRGIWAGDVSRWRLRLGLSCPLAGLPLQSGEIVPPSICPPIWGPFGPQQRLSPKGLQSLVGRKLPMKREGRGQH